MMDFGSAPAPLFRSESLRSKRTELLEELDSDNALSTGVFGGVVGVVSLPPILSLDENARIKVLATRINFL